MQGTPSLSLSVPGRPRKVIRIVKPGGGTSPLAKIIVLILVIAVVAVAVYFAIKAIRDRQAAEQSGVQSAESGGGTEGEEAEGGSGGGGGGSGGSGDSEAQPPSQCDPAAVFDTQESKCPLGYKPQRYGPKLDKICCVMDLDALRKSDAAAMGPVLFKLGGIDVSTGLLLTMATGFILEETLEKVIVKVLPKVVEKGLKVTAKVLTKIAAVATRAISKAATTAAATAARGAAQVATAAAKASAGPLGWILLALQVLSVIVDFMDPMNYGAFEPNRLLIGQRNMQIAAMEDAMRQAGQEAPFIFPLFYVYPKEFQIALKSLTGAAQAKLLTETLTEEEQVVWALNIVGAVTPEQQTLAEEVDRRMANVVEDMDPVDRDNELYKRMCILVGRENVMVDTTLSTKKRIAVTISKSRAEAFNEQNRCFHQSADAGFVPLAVHSKYYYTKDGTLSVGLLMGNSAIMSHIASAASALSNDLGRQIDPITTVPKLKVNITPSGQPITQISGLGAFKYSSCMGVRDCQKSLGFTQGLCNTMTLEPKFNYYKYGVRFDDDIVGCRYTCQLCERFGLELRKFEDPTISNGKVEYYDCAMYPTQDVFEMLLGETATKLLVQKYQTAARAVTRLAALGATAYNEMCSAMRPGSGGFCPTTCDKDACTDQKCREAATSVSNTVKKGCEKGLGFIKDGGCYTAYAACQLSNARSWIGLGSTDCGGNLDRCRRAEFSRICAPVTKTIFNDGMYAACKASCGVVNTVDKPICEGRKVLCKGVNALCKWTGDIPVPDAACSPFHRR